jgi:lipopolysaccharide/colanic/teichoic acid biosynthesis glycosyltransferase
MFSHLRFIDVIGYLSDGNGIGVILLNSDLSTLENIRKEILHRLNDAGLIQNLRHKPKKPIFKAYLYTGLQEKDNLELADTIKEFNSTNGSFFSLSRLNMDHIWPHPHRIRFRHIIKRCVDFTGALLGLIILSPVLLFCALAVKISDPKGPIIFKQTRVGKNGSLFTMYKFRSMYVDAEERKKELMALNETGGKTFKMKNDPRIYPFGRVLRKFSLDELPQLVNIINGDMSIVGPRPPLPEEVATYEPWHRMRLSVTPGLTCLWQVSGRSNISFEGQMRLDNDYIRRGGKLADDFKLILKTFKVVFKGEGAY